MSKRFPIPDFDRDQYKNMDWEPPKILSRDEQAKLVAAAKAGDAKVFGSYPVEADDAFYARFRVRGSDRHAVMIVLPKKEVKLVGRSWAWSIQRAVVVDSLDASNARVFQDWQTPRPMNTRLGPDQGVALYGGVVYALLGHRYSDYWLPNR
ncbi:MAG TPA: hypothetical protein VN878_01355, partial [Usitatibacter sp.]|nr:hypothetical protein [Usitatibacter sp.]